MSLKLVLKDYLRRIELLELGKKESERRPIPTIKELSESIGMSRTAISETMRGKRKNVNLKVLGGIIIELRHRGFDTQLDDVLVFEEGR